MFPPERIAEFLFSGSVIMPTALQMTDNTGPALMSFVVLLFAGLLTAALDQDAPCRRQDAPDD